MQSNESNPYQSPTTVEVSTSPRREVGTVAYQSLADRAQYVIYLLFAGIAASVVSLMVAVYGVSFWREVDAGRYSDEAGMFYDTIVLGEAILAIVVSIATVVFFLRWLHLAYRNLPALGIDRLNHSPGWAVGYFFIPIVNLFQPYRVVKEMWVRMGALLPGESIGTGMLLLWWLVWIFANQVSYAIMRTYMRLDDDSSAGQYIAVSYMEQFSALLWIVAGFLAIVAVRRVTQRQEKLAAAVVSQPTDAAFG